MTEKLLYLPKWSCVVGLPQSVALFDTYPLFCHIVQTLFENR
jgi:hypothetical protein